MLELKELLLRSRGVPTCSQCICVVVSIAAFVLLVGISARGNPNRHASVASSVLGPSARYTSSIIINPEYAQVLRSMDVLLAEQVNDNLTANVTIARAAGRLRFAIACPTAVTILLRTRAGRQVRYAAVLCRDPSLTR